MCAASASPPDEESLEGTLQKVLFDGSDSGWRVVQLQVPGKLEWVTAVGQLSGLTVGEPVRLSGRWINNPKFGRQFETQSYVPVQPTSVQGIQRYLGSGLVGGLGPGLAERIVDHFGLKTLEIIEQEPERLKEVSGIGKKRAQRIHKAWQGAQGIKEVMVFLHTYGVGTGMAVRIFKRYGARAVQVIKSNPYQLALEVSGIGFRTADQIAQALGLDPAAPERIEAGLLHALREAGDEGHVFLPLAELSERAAKMLGCTCEVAEAGRHRLALKALIIVEDDAAYLMRLHQLETEAAQGVLRVLQTPLRVRKGDPEAAVKAYEAQSGLTLADAQRAAIIACWSEKLLVITGGPGTGKTTIINGIIRLLEPLKTKILLTAPTGRAAKRMSETTDRESKTLHRLLEYAPKEDAFVRNEDNPLEAELVIVDEVSMVDISLICSLVQALPPRCQLVLVGDVDQLPSVGPGTVLNDIIESGRAKVARLTHIFRQAQQSLIVTNAHRVNAGQMPEMPKTGDAAADFYLFERNDPEEVLRTIETLVTERIPKGFKMDPQRDLQVLTPMHRGPLGAQNLNHRLQTLLNPVGTTLTRGQQVLRVGDKVMQTKNDYDLGVFNGDIGKIKALNVEDKTALVDFDGKDLAYDASALDHLTLSYACTIHKSQGSEYPAVIVPVSTQHFVMLHRNLIYTAITRGKRLVVLVGSRRALDMAVRNVRDQSRHCGLGARLKGPAAS